MKIKVCKNIDNFEPIIKIIRLIFNVLLYKGVSNNEMKNLTLVLMAFFLFNPIFSQDTKSILKEKDGLIEVLNVLKCDSLIKEGNYLLMDKNTVLVKGNFRNNEKVGIWTMYSSKDIIELVFNYDSGKVMDYNYPGKFDKKLYCRPPACLIGFDNLKLITQRKAKFPENFSYFDKSLLKVIIGFTIDISGNPEKFYIKKSCGEKNFDNQASSDIRAAVENEKWIPAIDRTNNPVSYEMEMLMLYTIM